MRTKPVRRNSLLGDVRDKMEGFAAATPARFAILIFAALVLVFTLLFSLPVATTSGEVPRFADAFFTAVSVICVTGLSTVDMGAYWSPLGHVFILIGVEIGGIGVLTLASILGLIISRNSGCGSACSRPATPTRCVCTRDRSPRARRCASAKSVRCWSPWR